MRFGQTLTSGTLLRRYKRFLADVRLEGGEEVTAHIANTGPMTGCAEPGSRILLSHHPDRGRKLPWSWELIEIGGHWVLVNTARPNAVVEEGIRAGAVAELTGYPSLRREARWGERSRLDMVLEDEAGAQCWVEVKSVTLKSGPRAIFPDAVTTRGRRHLLELQEIRAAGHRAVIFFLVPRGDCESVGPAAEIDPAYAETLADVMAEGVECLAYQATVGMDGVLLGRRLPFSLPDRTPAALR